MGLREGWASAPLRPLRRAVVVGGGIAGLLATRVLSDHCAQVTLVEKDASAGDMPDPRKGVPQGKHVHVLLMHGRASIEALLPGITAELRAAGAVVVNAGAEVAWHSGGGWRVRHESELQLLAMTVPSWNRGSPAGSAPWRT
jgi:2-polyprenyl-6-methoxyphenol hydroxylase-like FAD-dependent oxidoreductase